MKKLISAILALAICALFVVSPTYATSTIDSGTCGENLTWVLSSDGTLTISGNGPMDDYTAGRDCPWLGHTAMISKVVINDGVTSIGNYAFANPWSYNEALVSVTIPNSCTLIGEYAFLACRNIKEVKLPNSVKTIGKAAFNLCQSLETITIPDGITTINPLFGGCTKLTTVYIPNSVQTIESWTFNECQALTDIYYAGTQAQWQSVKIFRDYNDPLFSATIHFGNNPAPPRPDTPSKWAVPEVTSAINANLVPTDIQQGYTQPISRLKTVQLFITMLEQFNGKSIDEIMAERRVSITPGVFTDTTDHAVLAANALGIIQGVAPNRFDPNSTLTRAQAAAIVNRVAKVMFVDTSGYTHTFTDVTKHWVNPELGWPATFGIVNGVAEGKFSPNSKLTTEQAIVIAYRTYRVLPC